MEIEYKYDAFISYRHVSPDKEIAERLQKKLESYNPPRALCNLKKRRGWHIFRDETELPTSSNLSNDIKNALEESQFLIVICSKTTKDSRWCLEEIEYFKELHNGNNAKIITLVADGNPEDVFPPLLCNELIPVNDEQGNITYQNHIIEPLAANVAGKTIKAALKNLNTEFLRIVAPILGCGYDDLYNREHKKKIRRIFTLGSIVIALLLLFGIYNSAMLWKINNQKAALAAANEDLKKKTEELNQSNQSLQKSNKELAEKTKEAEDNLTEANRQKQVAEKNLTEAEKQRKLAEQNLSEANRQKKFAEDNLEEANNQRVIAESNAKEAKEQRSIAEESMRIAQNNEAAANEANRNLKIKTSEVLTNQAQMYLEDGNVTMALQKALESVELGDDIPVSTDTQNVLVEATGVYSTDEKMLCSQLKLSGYVEYMEFSEDGSRILAKDSAATIYVIDYEKSEVIKAYTLFEVFGKTDAYLLRDIAVEGNTGYVLSSDQVIAIDLNDGSLKWHHKCYATYLNEFIKNLNSEYIVLDGGRDLFMIRKSDGALCYSKEIEVDYSVSDYMYMDSTGVLYIAYNNNCLRVINMMSDSDLKYELSIDGQYDILNMGENENCVFLNISFKDSDYSYNRARLFCFNKSNMSVKWKTDYSGKYFSAYNLNQIFEFTHNIPDAAGVFYEATGIVVVSGQNVVAFNRENGEVYFETTEEYEDKILFCRPSGKRLIIGRATSITPETYLYNSADGDCLTHFNWYSFDKTRKYIACTDDERYALASERSSEISIYKKYTPSEFTALDKFPMPEVVATAFDGMDDNGNGIIAVYNSNYDDNGRYYYYVIVFDVCNDKLLMQQEVDLRINMMKFVGKDKIFIVDSEGNAEVLCLDGSIYTKMNLKDMIREAIDVSEDTSMYFDFYNSYIKTADNSILYMLACGIFEINLSDGVASMRKILYNKKLHDYCMSDSFVACLQEDYATLNDRIIYFKNGDTAISYIEENGIPCEFKDGTVSSLICNGSSDTIAFISKEGYIGIYKYGDNQLTRILFPTGELSPLKIMFSPDAEYIIAMCSNGEFVKYSLKTFEQIDKYISDMTVGSYSEFKFIDETTFIAYGYAGREAVLIDATNMKLKAKLPYFIYFMEKEKKILSYEYIDGNKTLICFDYLSTKELINFANSFFEKLVN